MTEAKEWPLGERFICLRDKIQKLSSSIANSSFVSQISKLTLLLLWNSVHLVVSMWLFVLGISHLIQSGLISSGFLRKYKSPDLRNLQYLAIVIDCEEVHCTSRVIELVHWLSNIGVKHICLYDKDGILKESKEIILEKLGSTRLWEEANGDKLSLDPNQRTLEFVSSSDVRKGVAKAANFFCSKYLKSSTFRADCEEKLFTEPNMTKALKGTGCGGPEPNLLLIFGPVRCHLGFPAWRIRYTEIVHMGPLKYMKYGSLLKAIHRFTMVHQNYGT